MIVAKKYDRNRALEYAKRWALSRNPLFYDFTGGGGNCTNFVSQCLLSGSLTMNPTDTFGWYYSSLEDRSPSWTGVREFYEFMLGIGDFSPKNDRIGPFCSEVEKENVELGDVVQLANSRGQFYHSLIVTGFGRSGEILISAQSNDALDRPLSTYNYAAARFLHIEGINIHIFDENEYFSNLIDAAALPPKDTIYLQTALENG
jgi:hypothetical protein